jgi:anti-sigma-K factor RskA
MSEHAWLEHTAAYALGALDEQDRPSFEAHLATCDICKAEVRELREVAGLLATAAAQTAAPAGLRDRIVADARQVRPIATATAAASSPIAIAPTSSGTRDARKAGATPARRQSILPWFVAAAAAIVAIVLGQRYGGERELRMVAQQGLDSVRRAMDSTALALRGRDSLIASLISPDVEAVSVSGSGPAPSAKYFFDRRANRIVIAANALPPAAQGRTYQLWGIETGRPPVSLGTFNSDASGRAVATLPIPAGLRVAVTAVTDEPAGGSPQPTTTPFLAATWKTD